MLEVLERPTHTTCIGCGCTDLRACDGGCSWLAADHDARTGVCSRCPTQLTAWRNQRAEADWDELLELPDRRAAASSPDSNTASLIQIGRTDI
ncbi:MAG: hypothetical protein HYX47_10415 [Burkholderiales bacterium]|nr:hypothetical protein [Burkholderiales bacterium]